MAAGHRAAARSVLEGGTARHPPWQAAGPYQPRVRNDDGCLKSGKTHDETGTKKTVAPWFSVSSVLKFFFAASPALMGRGVRMRYDTGVVRACSLFLKTLTRRTRRTTEMHGDVCASSDACLIREWPFCLTGFALRLEAISGCERTKPSVSKRTRFNLLRQGSI